MENIQLEQKCHNIVASLVLAGPENVLRDELRHLDANVPTAHSIIQDGRGAMEAVLKSRACCNHAPLVDYAREMLVGFIDDQMKKAGARELKLDDCTNEAHCTDGVFVETFSRLYRDDLDMIIVEYSDHLPEGVTPEAFYGDHLVDAFTLDELADIAACLAAKKYITIK